VLAQYSNCTKLVDYFTVCYLQTNQGIQNLTQARATELAGTDPDYATRDLYNDIALGHCPSWTFYIQVMTFKEAEKFRWNPFDLTKVFHL
jgi:catalase